MSRLKSCFLKVFNRIKIWTSWKINGFCFCCYRYLRQFLNCSRDMDVTCWYCGKLSSLLLKALKRLFKVLLKLAKIINVHETNFSWFPTTVCLTIFSELATKKFFAKDWMDSVKKICNCLKILLFGMLCPKGSSKTNAIKGGLTTLKTKWFQKRNKEKMESTKLHAAAE